MVRHGKIVNFTKKELVMVILEKFHSDPRVLGYLPWVVWGLGAAFFLAEYFARVSTGVMVPDLMRDFHVDALTLGVLSAFFYVTYIAMQLPVGLLVDRFGPHKLLTANSILCGLGCLLFAISPNVSVASLGRLLMGFGAAFAFVGSLKLASVWFPASRFGFLAGLTQALGMFGACIGDAPMAYSVETFGWRQTMLAVALVFVVLAILIGLLVRDMPPAEYEAASQQNRSDRHHDLWQGVVHVFSNVQSWINACYAGMVYAPTAVFAELWGVQFLSETYTLPRQTAAAMVGIIFVGWAVGGPISGWLSDKIGRRLPLMLASSLCGFFILSIVLYADHLPATWLFVLLFIYGMTNTGVATAYAVAAEINPRAIAGTSLALTNMASVIIGSGLQPVVGYLLRQRWDHQMLNGAPVYSASNYQHALMLLPLCSLISALLIFFIHESYGKNLKP